MRPQKWTELLVSLVDSTARGRARWRATDFPGRYVLATANGSVTLDGGPVQDTVGGVLSSLGTAPSLEVRDDDGAVVSELVGGIGGLSHRLQPSLMAHDGFTTGMDAQLENLVRQLVEAIGRGSTHAEEVVDGIIGDLG